MSSYSSTATFLNLQCPLFWQRCYSTLQDQTTGMTFQRYRCDSPLFCLWVIVSFWKSTLDDNKEKACCGEYKKNLNLFLWTSTLSLLIIASLLIGTIAVLPFFYCSEINQHSFCVPMRLQQMWQNVDIWGEWPMKITVMSCPASEPDKPAYQIQQK